MRIRGKKKSNRGEWLEKKKETKREKYQGIKLFRESGAF